MLTSVIFYYKITLYVFLLYYDIIKDINAASKNITKEILEGWVTNFFPFPIMYLFQGKDFPFTSGKKLLRMKNPQIFFPLVFKGKIFFKKTTAYFFGYIKFLSKVLA